MNPQAVNLGVHRLVICLGPGGVGKTTLSAALALSGAISGRAVDVMTVDPAARLMDALGLDGAASLPRPVSLSGLGARRGGRLRARRLDPKRMFDSLIERHAPSAAAGDAILSNRIYRNLSGALAGVADYMAMEQLLDLHLDNTIDLIVLDTPPAREALDFLDAPRRMLELLGSRAVTLLGPLRETRRGPLGIFDFAARAVLAAFDRLTGLHLLADVQSFVRGFDGMYAGFAERAAQARMLIRDEKSFIVLVTTAETERVDQACEFVASLRGRDLAIGAVAVNRITAPLPDAAEIARAELPAALKRKLRRNLSDYAEFKRREDAALGQLRESLPADAPVIIAPDLGREPRTLKDLAEIASTLHWQ